MRKTTVEAIANLNKDVGITGEKGKSLPFVQLGRAVRPDNVVVGTGMADFDYGILTLGGFPLGTLVTLEGEPSSGKSLISAMLVASAQEAFGTRLCGWCDAEQRLNAMGVDFLQSRRVDYEALVLIGSVPQEADPWDHYPVAERVLYSVEQLCHSGDFSVIVVDSLASLIPMDLWEKAKAHGKSAGPGKKHNVISDEERVAALPRIYSKWLKMLKPAAEYGNTLVICTTQMRANIRARRMVSELIARQEDDDKAVGGNALRFEASQRVRFAIEGDIEENGKVLGEKVCAKLIKSTVSPPRTVTYKNTPGPILLYHDGRTVSATESLVWLAAEQGMVQKSGSWYEWKGVKKQGLRQWAEYLDANLALRDEIEAQVRAQVTLTNTTPEPRRAAIGFGKIGGR